MKLRRALRDWKREAGQIVLLEELTFLGEEEAFGLVSNHMIMGRGVRNIIIGRSFSKRRLSSFWGSTKLPTCIHCVTEALNNDNESQILNFGKS